MIGLVLGGILALILRAFSRYSFDGLFDLDQRLTIKLGAIQRGLLTVAKEGKQNVFSGRILEIEGLPDLKSVGWARAVSCPRGVAGGISNV